MTYRVGFIPDKGPSLLRFVLAVPIGVLVWIIELVLFPFRKKEFRLTEVKRYEMKPEGRFQMRNNSPIKGIGREGCTVLVILSSDDCPEVIRISPDPSEVDKKLGEDRLSDESLKDVLHLVDFTIPMWMGQDEIATRKIVEMLNKLIDARSLGHPHLAA